MKKTISGDALKDGRGIIAHQVNCMGVMGGGIALQIKNKYPKVFQQYKALCDQYKDNPEDLLGRVQFVTVDEDQIIANVFGQCRYGRNPNTVYTNYDALREAFELIGTLCNECGYHLTIPHKFGSGLANGDWGVVKDIIYTAVNDVTIYAIDGIFATMLKDHTSRSGMFVFKSGEQYPMLVEDHGDIVYYTVHTPNHTEGVMFAHNNLDGNIRIDSEI